MRFAATRSSRRPRLLSLARRALAIAPLMVSMACSSSGDADMGPSFPRRALGVCIADGQGQYSQYGSHPIVASGLGEVIDAGTGVAPSSCEKHILGDYSFGSTPAESWWITWQSPDGQQVTFGTVGLGAFPPVAKGDPIEVALDVDVFVRIPGGQRPSTVRLANAQGRPLFWWGAAPTMVDTRESWITLAAIDENASIRSDGCGKTTLHPITATVDGESARILPEGEATLGGFRVVTGSSGTYEESGDCTGGTELTFHAAAIRVP